MAKLAYPTGQDIETFLQGAGIVSSPTSPLQFLMDFESAAAGAVTEFERRTDWRPFLAGPAASTRLFDPPGPSGHSGWYGSYRGGGRLLELDGGLLASVPPVVTVGIAPGSPGVVMTPGLQYYLRPNNAAARQQPSTWIEFNAMLYGAAQSVSVNGLWGWGVTVPDDAWQAIGQLAAVSLGPELQGSLAGGIVSYEADVKVQFGADPLGKLLDRWQQQAERVISRYRRPSLGG